MGSRSSTRIAPSLRDLDSHRPQRILILLIDDHSKLTICRPDQTWRRPMLILTLSSGLVPARDLLPDGAVFRRAHSVMELLQILIGRGQ